MAVHVHRTLDRRLSQSVDFSMIVLYDPCKNKLFIQSNSFNPFLFKTTVRAMNLKKKSFLL